MLNLLCKANIFGADMSEKVLSSSLEDYLECVYNRINLNGSVKAIEISKELNVSRASVTEALNKLAQKKYINYGRYEMISITDLGKEKAKEIINKHNVIQSFFENVLGIEKEEAAKTACGIEHVITENILEKLAAFNTFCNNESGLIEKFRQLS